MRKLKPVYIALLAAVTLQLAGCKKYETYAELKEK